MVRYLLMGFLAVALSVSVSCGSKKKGKDADASGDLDGSVVSKDMNFDPQGSDSGNIEGLHTVNFEFDQASLTSEARRKLSENADWLKEHSGVTVQIEGHCDKRGSVEYNLALGERRAKAAKNYLVSLGVEPGRLTIISYGEEKPLAEGSSASAHSKNRRANFVPLGS